MKIVVTTDSTSDLPKEILEKYNIGVMPLVVILGEEEYHDGADFSVETIFQYVNKTGILPKTAARSSLNYKEFFQDFMKNNKADALIHISLSSELSSSYSNAKLASEELENVWVIDSRSLSSGSGLHVLSCIDKINEGKQLDIILEELDKETSKIQASFIINNLKYLYKGGRCSAIAVFGANIMMIKPKIKLTEGKMIVDRKYMGKSHVVLSKYLQDLLSEYKDVNKKRVFITYSSMDETVVDKLKSQLQSQGFEEVITNFAGATVASHCGENCLGVVFMLNYFYVFILIIFLYSIISNIFIRYYLVYNAFNFYITRYGFFALFNFFISI